MPDNSRRARQDDAYTGSPIVPPRPILSDELARPRDPHLDTAYTYREAAEIAGITYRQLDYWMRTDLIRPSIGLGPSQHFSYRDLIELRIVKTLLDAGVKLESVRDLFSGVRAKVDEQGMVGSNLVFASGNFVLVHDGYDLIDLVRRGEGVLNILPLGGIKNEVDQAIARVRSPAPQEGPD